MSGVLMTREKKLDLLCFTLMFLGAIGVVGGFVGATSGCFGYSQF